MQSQLFCVLLVVGYASSCTFPSYVLTNATGAAVSASAKRWFARRFYETAADEEPAFDLELHIASTYILVVQSTYNCSNDQDTYDTCSVGETTVLARLGCLRRVTAVAVASYDAFELKWLEEKGALADNYCVAFKLFSADLVVYHFVKAKTNLPNLRRCEALYESIRTEASKTTPPLLVSVDYMQQMGRHDSSLACPLTGGFIFRSYTAENVALDRPAELVCSNDTWRVSQLDSDCFPNEGLEFSFPKPSCNVFNSDSTSTKALFSCGKQWLERGTNRVMVLLHDAWAVKRYPLVKFWLMLMSTPPKANAFDYNVNVTVLRTMLDFTDGDNGTFAANYALTAREAIGQSFFLQLHRRDPVRVCDDESHECDAKKSLCVTKPAYEFAAFCPRTCERCTDDQLVDGPHPECEFRDADLQGSWHLHGDASQTVEVDASGVVRLPRNDDNTFACKSFDSNAVTQRYNLQKHFRNGCLPRQICYEFWQLQSGSEDTPSRSITMIRQNSRSRTVSDAETISELCNDQMQMPLAKSAVPRSTNETIRSDSQPFRLLLRYPLLPQKCGLYGFYIAVSFGNFKNTFNATARGASTKRDFAVLTDLNFTTCRHNDRLVMKNLQAERLPIGLPTEQRFRCYGRFKLHRQSDDDLLIVMDETVTGQYFCAVFAKLSEAEARTLSLQRNASTFTFNGMLHLVPLQNCTFDKSGFFANSLSSFPTWLYKNDVRYINNCQQDQQSVDSTETRQFQQIYYSLRQELQPHFVTDVTRPMPKTTLSTTTRRSIRSTRRAQTQSMVSNCQRISITVYAMLASLAITLCSNRYRVACISV